MHRRARWPSDALEVAGALPVRDGVVERRPTRTRRGAGRGGGRRRRSARGPPRWRATARWPRGTSSACAGGRRRRSRCPGTAAAARCAARCRGGRRRWSPRRRGSGLTSAPGTRLSTRIAWPWPTTRKPSVRLSTSQPIAGRRPAVGLEPLVAVDVRREQQHQLAGRRQQPAEVPAEHVAHPALVVGVGHHARAPSALHRLEWMWQLEPASSTCGLAMNVADRPRAWAISLTAVLNSRLMSAISTAVWNVRLTSCWPRAGLALGVLEREPGPAQPAADGAEDVLLLARLEDRVVLDVGRVRRSGRGSRRRGRRRRPPGTGRTRARCRASARSRRRRPARPGPAGCGVARPRPAGPSSTSTRSTSTTRGRLVPRQVADRRLVDDAAHVAVALLVAGPAEPGDRRVVEVAGEEVVAVLGPLACDDVEVEVAVRALADQAALVVGEGDDDGVDAPGLDVGAQGLGWRRAGSGPRVGSAHSGVV